MSKLPKRVIVDITGKPFSCDAVKMLRARKPYSILDPEKPMSKAQLARHIGCHEQQILRWERLEQAKDYEKRSPRAVNIKKLALFFQVDPTVLLGLTWMFGEQADRYDEDVLGGIVKEDFCDKCGKYIGDIDKILKAREL